MQPKLKELVVASFSFEAYSSLYVKILLLNAVMFVTIVISFVFFFLNLFLVHNYLLASVDMLIFTSISYALYLLRHKGDHDKAGYIATAALFLLQLAIMLTQHGDEFTLIWSYFFAPFAMVALGAQRGLRITFVFFLIIFTISFLGVGEWIHGYWDMASFFRYVLSQIVMLYVMYAIFHANEKADEKIEALRLHEKEQLKRFEKLSLTDPLTGVYNRRFLHEIFPQVFYTAKREGKKIAFFLLDIDHFKPYNDSLGHERGDNLLVKIADVLQEGICGKDDYVFRIGGDEFAGIVVADSDIDIENRIYHMHYMIIQLRIQEDSRRDGAPVTVSIGAHICTNEEYHFKEIYEAADKALYKTKSLGRNGIQFI